MSFIANFYSLRLVILTILGESCSHFGLSPYRWHFAAGVSALQPHVNRRDDATNRATPSTLQGIVTLLFVPSFSLWLLVTNLIVLIVVMFAIGCSLSALGIVISSRMASGSGIISNFVVLLMYLLSGTVYPLRSTPDWSKGITVLNPLTYGVDAKRHIAIRVGSDAFFLNKDLLSALGFMTLLIA